MAKTSKAKAADDGRTYVVGEPGPELDVPAPERASGGRVDPESAPLVGDGPGSPDQVVKAKPFGRPKPRYCAQPNCGRRPKPGSRTCAHHREVEQ